jgi:spermidine synthase
MTRILVAYALSGFISLGYQVAWFRIFTDWYGSTSLTFALVVCSFIGGLGVGAVQSQRIARLAARALRTGDALRVYGAVEIAIAAAAGLTVLLGVFPAADFPYAPDGAIWAPARSQQVAQILTVVVCVFLPCVLMGVTFPLLCSAFLSHPAGGRFPARLYAWNTLGACAGVLACQFALILWIGHEPTFWLMLVLNALLGLYFLWAGGAPAAAPATPAAGLAPAGTARPAASRELTDHYPTLVFLAGLSGFLAGSLEGDLFKRLSFLAGAAPGATMTFVSFWVVLATFLASLAVDRLPKLGIYAIRIAFLAAVGLYFGVWHYRWWIVLRFESAGSLVWFPSSLVSLFLVSGVFAFAPYFLISLLLPFLCNQLQADRRHLGLAYGVNTLAFCAGLVGFAVLAPTASIFFSLRLSLLVLGLGALALFSIEDLRRAWRLQVPVLAGIGALAVALTPRGFDPAAFSPTPPERWKTVTELRADPAHTTFVVVESSTDLRLYFDGHSMSGTNPYSQTYMRLMAHVPLLAQENPRAALLVCFGVGNTASALASHRSLERIDVVDLSRNVLRTAPVFGPTSRDVHRDPRLRMIADDGRGFLRRTRETYDLITSEPPPPMAAGVYRLYSREYYEYALARLSPGGMMSQWLPIYQLPQPAADLILRTFVQVFPHVLLFRGIEDELILVGSRVPVSLEDAVRGMGRDPEVAQDLARIGVVGPEDLRGRRVAGDAELRARYGTGRVLRDQHNDLEHLFRNPDNEAVVAVSP